VTALAAAASSDVESQPGWTAGLTLTAGVLDCGTDWVPRMLDAQAEGTLGWPENVVGTSG
jgi:hypothetical protein